MKKAYWVQRLGFNNILMCCIRSIFSATIIYYDEKNVTAPGKVALNISGRLGLSRNFVPLSLPGDKKDDNGCTLFYRIYEAEEDCIAKFCRHYIHEKPEWFKKMITPFLIKWDSTPFYFIAMIQDLIHAQKNVKHFVCITGYPVCTIIKKFNADHSYEIKTNIFFDESFYREMIRPFYMVFMIILNYLMKPKVRTNIENIRPSIWVEYGGMKTMLSFWRDYVSTESYDTVYYIDRYDDPLDAEYISKCEREGFKWIDAHNSYALTNFSLKEIRDILLAFFSYDTSIPLWLNLFMFRYAVLYAVYLSIFRRFKVKIVIQFQCASWLPQVQANAIESSGGIMIGFHWSTIHVPLPFFLTPEHVFFVWGKLMYEYMHKNGNTCRHILPCGLWILPDALDRDCLKFPDNVNFVIAIVDASVAHNLYQTPDTLSQYYLMVIDLLEDNPQWGGIVKSKNFTVDELIFLPSGDRIVSKMKKLMGDGRLIVLDFLLWPTTASAHADLTVSYCLQTAGEIAGVQGNLTVIWDVAGWLRYPLYRDAKLEIFYDTINNFKRAIIKVAGRDYGNIGDFTNWRKMLNHFEDSLAPQRVGYFIDTFMMDVVNTGDPIQSLDFAVDKYRTVNGVTDDFFKITNLW